jgi:hypothetical protein
VVKDPGHRFLHYLCETFGKNPDDDFFEEMDPFVKLWWFEHWSNKIVTELENYKSLAILVGSFSNLEMAQKMVKKDNPDFQSSEEDVEKSMKMIREYKSEEEIQQATTPPRRRRRKVVKE